MMGSTKWVMYVVEATTSYHRTEGSQKWSCSTTLGSLPKNITRSMSRMLSICRGNLMRNNPSTLMPSSAAPRVAS